ncbi:MAG TPA: UpxY family transcription antiterminator [Puia sp.]|nr:UpxY family transcription antiterminator [Puia sp.]
MSSFNSGWYVMYTRPRHEKKVQQQLSERSITTFLPMRKSVRQWSDRKKIVIEPLFPSYLFVYLKDMDNFFAGKDADGYLYYVRSGEKIAVVNDEVVNSVKLVAGEGRDVEVTTEQRFPSGVRLVISKGPLTGLSCEVVEFQQKQKLLVRVDLLQRNILMSLPEESLTEI